MAVVSIFEGGTEHRFNVPPGYKPVINDRGHGELVIDPNYQPRQETLPGMTPEEQMGQRAFALTNVDTAERARETT